MLLNVTRRSLRPKWWMLATAATLPPMLMLIEISKAPVLNFNDYWLVIDRLTASDGSLLPTRVFTLQNEHPTFLPGLAYYADARWLGGTNHPLALLAWLMALGVLALLVRLLPADLPPPAKAGLVVLFAALLYAPKGLHNYAYGMSGVAWMSANLAVVGALYTAHRGKMLWAMLLGTLACLCYGTGFAVWPALVVLLILRKHAWWPVPIALGLIFTTSWFVLLKGPAEQPSGAKPSSLYDVLGTTLTTIGGLSASSLSTETPLLVGAVIVAALAAAMLKMGIDGRSHAEERASSCAAETTSGDRDALVPWAALAAYGLAASLLVGLSRAGFQAGGSGRYASVAALTTAAAVTIFAVPRASTRMTGIIFAAAALIALSAGARTAVDVRATYPLFSLQAVAIAVGAPAAVPELPFPPSVAPKLKELEAYPFSNDFQIGCGYRLGDTVKPATVANLPNVSALSSTGTAGVVDMVKRSTGIRAEGWAAFEGRRAECVLVTDADGLVVGGGIVAIARPDVLDLDRELDATLGWAVVGPLSPSPLKVVFVSEHGLFQQDLGT